MPQLKGLSLRLSCDEIAFPRRLKTDDSITRLACILISILYYPQSHQLTQLMYSHKLVIIINPSSPSIRFSLIVVMMRDVR